MINNDNFYKQFLKNIFFPLFLLDFPPTRHPLGAVPVSVQELSGLPGLQPVAVQFVPGGDCVLAPVFRPQHQLLQRLLRRPAAHRGHLLSHLRRGGVFQGRSKLGSRYLNQVHESSEVVAFAC